MSAERPEAAVGELAIVLHTHMPYVEGFGTYPFGEEWLFDAVLRSHLPVLEVARDLTISVTPVLADQLEAPGVGERLRRFLETYRIGAAELDLADVDADARAAVAAELDRYRAAGAALERCDGEVLAAFAGASAERNLELIPSAATHAVLPLLATRQGRALQIDAGLRSHRRRFGRSRGFWLPECGYAAAIDRELGDAGVEWFATDQSAHLPDGHALAPIASPAGPVAVPIDWPTIELAWSFSGYPCNPRYADFHWVSHRGMRIWSIGGEPYDPVAAAEQVEADAAAFLDSVRARLEAHRQRTGSRGLLTFAIDTELLGHWWAEGPAWLAAVLDGARAAGVEPVTVSQGLAGREPVELPLRRSSWGEGKDLSTWDSRRVADLAWAARRLELRLVDALAARPRRGDSELRAARELLAVQASDWAFLDNRAQAGDYPFARSTGHAAELLAALNGGAPGARLRNLAPDLSLAPLVEP